VPEESYAIPFGEASIVREGDDATIVTYGRMVHLATDAAANLRPVFGSCSSFFRRHHRRDGCQNKMGSDYDKTTHRHVEIVDDHSLEPDLLKPADVESEFFDGDVNLSGPGDIVYLIPTPSTDPRGTYVLGSGLFTRDLAPSSWR